MRSADAFHLPGLNTLRFYAALCVVLSHLENQFDAPTPLTQALGLLTLDAQSAVNFFFVLSGFLITLLLLRERKNNGQVSVRNFYVRRILRIWPLYYLIVAIGLFVFPRVFGASYPLSDTRPLQLFLVLALLPNFAGLTAPLVHLWSIGVEEQFYALRPWTARRDNILLRAIAGILFLKIALVALGTFFFPTPMLSLLMDLRFECMAIGALVAFVYFKQTAVLKSLYHPLSQWLAALVMLCCVIFYFPQTLFVVIVSSGSFAVIILNVATNPRAWLRLNYAWGERLGEISYGVYMYHFPVLYVCVFMLARLSLSQTAYMPALYAATIATTLFTARLSYQYLEKPVLGWKTRWSRPRESFNAIQPIEHVKSEIPGNEVLRVPLD